MLEILSLKKIKNTQREKAICKLYFVTPLNLTSVFKYLILAYEVSKIYLRNEYQEIFIILEYKYRLRK